MLKTETIYKGKDAAGNAMKAARKALGSDAKRGIDFDVVQVEGGAVWRARDLSKTAEPNPRGFQIGCGCCVGP